MTYQWHPAQYDHTDDYENVPAVDAIWQTPIGRRGHHNPSRIYEPTPERIAQLGGLPYHAYLETPEWKERRRMALLAGQHRCNRCRSTAPLHVHHRTYAHVGDEWPEDLEVLCADCHRAEHGLD